MKGGHGRGALLAVVALSVAAVGPVAISAVGVGAVERRRRFATQGRAGAGGAQSPGRHDAPRCRAVRRGAPPRRRPGRPEPSWPDPGGRGRLVAGLARLPPLPERVAVRCGIRAESHRGGAGVVRAAERGPDGGHAGPGQRPPPGQRDRRHRVGRVRHTARAGAGARARPGGRQHVVARRPVRCLRARDRRRRARRRLLGALHGRARARPHAPARRRPPDRTPDGTGRPQTNQHQHQPASHDIAHAGTPQACAAASGAAPSGSGIYTSTQMSSFFGLNQLFAQGRTGVGQTIAIVEFEQYSSSDFPAFQSCYGLIQPDPQRDHRRWPGWPGPGEGEAPLDTELPPSTAPVRVDRRLRGAERQRRPGLRPLQPDRERRHGERW